MHPREQPGYKRAWKEEFLHLTAMTAAIGILFVLGYTFNLGLAAGAAVAMSFIFGPYVVVSYLLLFRGEITVPDYELQEQLETERRHQMN